MKLSKGGKGNDKLVVDGGAGTDNVRIKAGKGNVVVYHVSPGKDKVRIHGGKEMIKH